MLSKLTTVILASVLAVSSCKKEPSGSTVSTLGVKIQATGKSFSLLKSTLVTTPVFSWDTCFMTVSKIEFEAEKLESEMSHDSSEVHIEMDGAKRIDLFNLNSVVGDIPLQMGTFHEVTLKITALKVDAGSAPVFYLEGTYTNSADSVVPVVVSVNEDFEFKVKQEGSSLDGTSDYTGLINFSLNMLMANIQPSDLAAATITNKKIIINSNSNVSLYNKIKLMITTCAETKFSKGHETESGSNSSNSNSGNGNNGNNGGGNGGDGTYHY